MKAAIQYVQSVLSILGKYKSDVRKGYIAAFFESGFAFAPYMLLFYIILISMTRKITPRDVLYISLAMVLSVILRAVCKVKQDKLQQNRGLYALTEKRLEIADHLSKLNMGYYSDSNIGNVSAIVSGDITFLEELAYVQTGILVSAVASWIISIIYIFVFNIKLGLFYFLCSCLGALAISCMNKAMVMGVYQRQENFGMLSEALLSFIQGLPTIKAFNMMREKNSHIEETIKKVSDDAVTHVKKGEKYFNLYALISNGLTGIFALFCLYLYKIGDLELPWTIGFVIFSFILFMPIQLIGGTLEVLSVGDAAVKRLKKVLAEERIENKNNDLKIKNMEVEFKDVHFAYENSEVLKGISFTIKPHTFTALVGESGSGKSTITSLMARFWDIQKGEILIDGKNIKDYPIEELMKNISMVFSDVFLFNDSIKNNIAFGDDTATMEDVIKASKKARCHDFIMKLPEGYDTIIGEGGSSLSEGEKQRISIARAMLKDAKLVLLDEATAGVDPDNEKFIQEAMENLVKDKTLVVIAHRLSIIQNADQILVLKEGEIVERGTSEELIKQGGTYKRQYEYYSKIKEN